MKNKELNEKYKLLMTELLIEGDIENDHQEADKLLSNLLIELGFDEVVNIFDKVTKWYV